MIVSALTAKHATAMAAVHACGFSRPWSERDFSEHITNAFDHCLGIFDGDDLAGFMVLRCQPPQSEILTVAVAPLFQRKGIAKVMLKAAVDHACAERAAVMFLEVAADNLSAIALYKQAGFHHYAERPGYYKRAKGRVAAKLMKLSIAQD